MLGDALLSAGPVRTAAVLAASAALSVASLHLVEDPVRRSAWLSRRPRQALRRRRARAAVALAAVVGLVVGGWVVPALALRSRRRPGRLGRPTARGAARRRSRRPGADLASEIATSVAPAQWPALDAAPRRPSPAPARPSGCGDRCDNVDAGNVGRCRYGDLRAPRTAVVVGDSMATSWLPALREVLDPQEWSIQVLTRNQCPLPRLGFWRERPDRARSPPATSTRTGPSPRSARLRPDLVLASNSSTFLDHQQGQPAGAARFTSWRGA